MKAKLIYVNNGKPERDLELWDETRKICGFTDVRDFGRLEAAIDGSQERVRELEEEISRMQSEVNECEDDVEIDQLKEDLEWMRKSVKALEKENSKLRSAGKKIAERIRMAVIHDREIFGSIQIRTPGGESFMFMNAWLREIAQQVEELEEEE